MMSLRLSMPKRAIASGRVSMMCLQAYGSTRFAAPTPTAVAPASISSRTSCALYACHTNLDSAPEGMSQMLGNLLGLRNVILLEPTATEMPGSGFGIVGEPEHVLPTEEFLRTVRDRLSLKCIRYSGITRPTVRRAALCTGAGASMMSAAKRAGADVYLSADFKYNDFLDADRELVIADIGHFESEYCAIDLIYEIIRKKMPTFAL